MDNILLMLQNNILLIATGGCIAILMIWNIALSVGLKRLKKKYTRIMAGSTTSTLESAILQNADKSIMAVEKVTEMKTHIETLEKQLEGCIQRVDIIRYNAFSDTGSDLSYSLALLNNKNDGLILTGIYGRNEAYTYAKPIKSGESSYALSEEEIQVLKVAKK